MMNYLCFYVVVPDVCLRKKAFSGVHWVVGFQVKLEEHRIRTVKS